MSAPSADPRLQSCAKEIVAILNRYDIGASVILCSGNGHSEYVRHITEPTWSALTVEARPEGMAIRIRARVKSAAVEERLMERIKLQKTVDMVYHLQHVTAMDFDVFDRLLKLLRTKLNITAVDMDHIPKKGDHGD